jgi:hypothetical protein
LGAKNDKKPTPPNLKSTSIQTSFYNFSFYLASPYCPQTPKNGGFKNLLNQTIKVFVSQNQNLHFKSSPGWSPQELGN